MGSRGPAGSAIGVRPARRRITASDSIRPGPDLTHRLGARRAQQHAQDEEEDHVVQLTHNRDDVEH